MFACESSGTQTNSGANIRTFPNSPKLLLDYSLLLPPIPGLFPAQLPRSSGGIRGRETTPKSLYHSYSIYYTASPKSPREPQRALEVRFGDVSRGLETLSHRRSGRRLMVEPAEGSPRRVLGGQVRPLPALGLGASGLAEHRRRG